MPFNRPDRRDLQRTARSTSRARDLRKNMSPPEVVLWAYLRGRKLKGLRFRRQHPLGEFIADFYCHEADLVVEIDSRFHVGDRRRRDAARDAWMRERGVEVLRLTASELATNLDAALAAIARAALGRIARGLRTPSGLADSATSPASSGEDGESAAAR
jgi:very-short-patch-repair endonuclease